jgi:hypothetical protein
MLPFLIEVTLLHPPCCRVMPLKTLTLAQNNAGSHDLLEKTGKEY